MQLKNVLIQIAQTLWRELLDSYLIPGAMGDPDETSTGAMASPTTLGEVALVVAPRRTTPTARALH